jgi:hypothetical protein
MAPTGDPGRIEKARRPDGINAATGPPATSTRVLVIASPSATSETRVRPDSPSGEAIRPGGANAAGTSSTRIASFESSVPRPSVRAATTTATGVPAAGRSASRRAV